MTDQPASIRVLDAAARLFADRGYQATTTRQIAELAGVNEVTIFRGFGKQAGRAGRRGRAGRPRDARTYGSRRRWAAAARGGDRAGQPGGGQRAARRRADDPAGLRGPDGAGGGRAVSPAARRPTWPRWPLSSPSGSAPGDVRPDLTAETIAEGVLQPHLQLRDHAHGARLRARLGPGRPSNRWPRWSSCSSPERRGSDEPPRPEPGRAHRGHRRAGRQSPPD